MSDHDLAGADDGDGVGLLTKLPIILWERRWLIIIPTVLAFVAGCAAALLLPTTYQSRAVMLVESQTLIGQPDTDTDDNEIDRRIAKIRQQLMSRPDLVELIQTHNLYDASSSSQPLSALVEQVRDATDIAAVDANITSGSKGRAGQSSIAFALTFKYPRADLAQTVAQAFTDRLLKLSVTQSQDEVASSVRVLEDQAGTLQSELDGIEGRIRQITGQNGAALANAQAFGGGVTSTGTFDAQISQLQRENAQLRIQSGTVALERDPNVVAAESALAVVRAQYSDDHPDVLLARSRLAAARATAAQVQSRATNVLVQAQLSNNDAAIAQLQQARSVEQTRAAQLSVAQSRGPGVAAQVGQLQAQAELVRTNLGKVNTSLLSARSAAKLTDEQRGDRLALIEPAARPDTPSSPNRPLLVIGGLAAGLGAGIALALLLELIQRPIRSAATIRQITGVAPLAVVPKLSRKRPKKSQRRFRLPFGRRANI